MYPARCDTDEMDFPPARFVRQLGGRRARGCDSPGSAEDEIVANAEMRLLAAYVRQTTGFRLERLARILEDYQGSCQRNDNVTALQHAASEILRLMASPLPHKKPCLPQ
ncbi:MAG: hypothetical protein AB7I37_08035 [Pirellulales bacterium]